MIWIFEDLDQNEIDSLESLNPLMDYHNNGNAHVYRTFCSGWEIKDGIMSEVRKIRFFNIDETKQGFICDDLSEAMDLSWMIQGISNKKLNEKYPSIKKYLQNKDNIWVQHIALSVMAFIKYGAKNQKSLLDNLDCNLLNKYDVDYKSYIPIKKYEPYQNE
ncbi:hypothetical protein H8E88_23280 [candidate division KSB1 bacterium]|nr:hypothetical protein [candidate division KSB1 bacterium]